MNKSGIRSRWAAVGAAVAVTLGAGGIGLVSATSPAGATAYIPIEPCRVADTRAGEFNVGDKNTPIGQQQTHVITAHGDNGECTGIPTAATGLQLNVTALDATAGTFLAVWGSGDRPNSSNLNPQPGQPPIPNAVTTGLTGSGQFNVYNQAGSVNVIVDIVGYYADHNHDDRYYTEAEVDATVGAVQTNVATLAGDVNNMTRVHFARVAANGVVEKTSNQGISVEKTGTGAYDVELPENASNCAVETSLNAHATGFGLLVGLAYLNGAYAFSTHDTEGDAKTVRVFTVIADGADGDTFSNYSDLPFTVTAYCSDPLLVFNPGVIVPPIIGP